MSNPIKLGLVGIGRAGWGMHVSDIEKKPDKYQYVAACDLLPERVQKMVDKFGCKGSVSGMFAMMLLAGTLLALKKKKQ